MPNVEPRISRSSKAPLKARRSFSMLLPCLIFVFSAFPARELGADEVSVGLLVASTGDVASMGQECRKGFLAAASHYPNDIVGAHIVRYIWGDHRGEARSGVAEFQRLVDFEHVLAVATHHSQPSMQMNPLSRRKRVPLLSVAGHVAFLRDNPYAYRFWYSTKGETALLASALRAQLVERIAVVSVQDEYALSFRESLIEDLRGVSRVHDTEVSPQDREFQTVLARIKAARPQALIANLSIPQVPIFMAQARGLSLQADVTVGNGWFGLTELQSHAASGLLDGVLFAVLSPPDEMLGRGASAVSASPISYTCFTELAALLEAIERCSAPVTAVSLHQKLSELTLISRSPVPVGMRDREAWYPLDLMTYRGGKPVPASATR